LLAGAKPRQPHFPAIGAIRFMHRMKHFGRAVFRFVKQTCFLPQTVAIAIKQRRLQATLDENEAERLDRIRNPSKYRGK